MNLFSLDFLKNPTTSHRNQIHSIHLFDFFCKVIEMDAERKNIFLLVGILVILLGTIIILSTWHNKVINALNQKRDLNRTTKDTFTSNGSSQYQYNDIKTGAMHLITLILYLDKVNGGFINNNTTVSKLENIRDDESNSENNYFRNIIGNIVVILNNVTAIRSDLKNRKRTRLLLMNKVNELITKFSEIIISLYDNGIMFNQNDDEQTKIVTNLRGLISDTDGGKKRLKLLSLFITIMIIRNTTFSYIIEKILSLSDEELHPIDPYYKLLDEAEEALNKIHESGSTGETQPTARVAADVSD